MSPILLPGMFGQVFVVECIGTEILGNFALRFLICPTRERISLPFRLFAFLLSGFLSKISQYYCNISTFTDQIFSVSYSNSGNSLKS